MDTLYVLLLTICHFSLGDSAHDKNITSPKDMYVIRATVYQVGILTNTTKDSNLNKTGQQEAIAFFHNKGHGLNLHDLPLPLSTNVSAENLLGLAPVNNTWSLNANSLDKASKVLHRLSREVVVPGNITKATLCIPHTGVQSISLPLLSLNNNISKIPVPIPNLSVVSYTKANTFVRKP